MLVDLRGNGVDAMGGWKRASPHLLSGWGRRAVFILLGK